jgi:hypothetical protein
LQKNKPREEEGKKLVRETNRGLLLLLPALERGSSKQWFLL